MYILSYNKVMGLKDKIIKKLSTISEDSELFTELNKLLFPCQHKVQVQKKQIDDFDYDSPQCEKCKEDLGGWYCPDSPDHLCHYFSQKNRAGEDVIYLLDGTEVNMKSINPEHQVKFETDDDCVYCHDPRERK